MRIFFFHVNQYHKNIKCVKLNRMSTRSVNRLFPRTDEKLYSKEYRERETRERRDLPAKFIKYYKHLLEIINLWTRNYHFKIVSKPYNT